MNIRIKFFPNIKGVRLLLPLVLLYLCCFPVNAQEPTLSKIEFAGLQRHTHEEAVAASGLQTGQLVNVNALDAAAQRLMDSGWFKKLSYRYRTTGDQAIVTFQVEEDKGTTWPVVFDNFVWFSDEELISAVRRYVPGFEGTASDAAIDGITKGLQELLAERKVEGNVEYAPSGSLHSRAQEHIFSVDGVSIPICELQFPGATGVGSNVLLKTSKPLFEGDYGRGFIVAFAHENLIPIYRERGYLRAKFNPPAAKVQSNADAKCKSGVSVDLPVIEGAVYSWQASEWVGNAEIANEQLEATLGMKSGEVANGLKIDKGIEAIKDAYGKQGYLAARLQPVPVFDDAASRVTYQISIDEGAQFRMGELTLTGLADGMLKRLSAKWKLKTGDVYDASYLKEYLKKDLPAELRSTASIIKGVESSISLDTKKLLVDVVIAFKK